MRKADYVGACFETRSIMRVAYGSHRRARLALGRSYFTEWPRPLNKAPAGLLSDWT